MTPARPSWPSEVPDNPGWEYEESVRCVVCPGCAFTFAAIHNDSGTNRYTCPNCEGGLATPEAPSEEVAKALEELVATFVLRIGGKVEKRRAEALTAARLALAKWGATREETKP